MLVCSAFNGLSQRVWLRLRATGHEVVVHEHGDGDLAGAAARVDPDIILCPYLRERVPASVWQRYRTIIIHPGPVGDRGPSSLDWAILEGHRRWGVTALQAIDEMDAGPIWGTRAIRLPATPVRKSALYNGPVTAAAVDLVDEVVRKAADPGFVPVPLVEMGTLRTGRLRPTMHQSDRAFSWEDPTDRILRRIHAADGSPGVRTRLLGRDLRVYDAHAGPPTPSTPGRPVARHHGALLVGTGDGSIWIGHAKPASGPPRDRIKLPTTLVLAGQLADVPVCRGPARDPSLLPRRGEITYHRDRDVGVVTADLHNGAMSTDQCRRLAAALRHARTRGTRALVLVGGESFSNGIHLAVIEAAAEPEREAWDNIRAIDDVCLELLSCDAPVVAAVGGNAGAGGVMLALAADHVVVRDGVVLNPHYATMGLFGSEYWTAVLPARVGPGTARRITEACLPVSAFDTAAMGLADEVVAGTRAEVEAIAVERARQLACDRHRFRSARRRRPDRTTLTAARSRELDEMARDIFDDRNGFAAARGAFVHGVAAPAPTVRGG